MKFVSFAKEGSHYFGVMVTDGIIDLTKKILATSTLKELIEARAMGMAAEYIQGRSADYSAAEVSLLPVIPDPGKIICVGLNYIDHVKETGRELADHPVIFHRYAESQVGHEQALYRPKVSEKFDYEGEMAVIMSGGGRHIEAADALNHIAGYSCYNDATVRDWQSHTRQFGMAKNFLRSGAFGPWMVSADEIPNYRDLSLQTRLNGEVMQSGKLQDLAFDIPNLISYVSKALPWNPGDVLVTGTPGGVGFKRNPPVFLKPGDCIEVEVSKIGILSNPVEDES
jgi:2-keto-4-pentenoate hydratase/2-oxohepta-3-ene-1,7-dioic acid hydratase in catechol pathway